MPSPGAANTLLCPKCAGVMKTYERNGIHLEQCDTCRGIFLDFGELESMTQMENRFVQAPPPPVQPGYGYGEGPAGATAATSTTASRASAACSSPARPSGRTPPPAARHRDDARPPAPRRPWRTDREPATGRRRQRGSIRVAICVEERRPICVGDQARRPEAGWTGEVPRRVAASEVVDVEQQPRACRPSLSAELTQVEVTVHQRPGTLR